jgi:hypothetical protein
MIPGDNLLHHTIRELKGIPTATDALMHFSSKLKSQDNKTLSDLSRQTNNTGQIPIDLIVHQFLNNQAALIWGIILMKILIAMMLDMEVKPINKLQPLKPFDNKDPLQVNLNTANQVVNAVRTIMRNSMTHPDCNKLSRKDNAFIAQKILTVRARCDTLFPIAVDAYIQKSAQYVMDEGTGNCEEFSYVALYKLHDINPHISGEIYRISNGDHCFLIIGRQKDSDIYDWNTWGEHAVVCDAWLGEAFPVKAIPEKLADFTSHCGLNFITSFRGPVEELTKSGISN